MKGNAGSAPRWKVLRVIARLNVGGPARHVMILDEGLRSRGHQTLLVHGSIGPGEASFDEVAAARVRVVRIRQLGRRISLLGDIHKQRILVQHR